MAFRDDVYTHSEEDAGHFDRFFGDHYDDRPTLAEILSDEQGPAAFAPRYAVHSSASDPWASSSGGDSTRPPF